MSDAHPLEVDVHHVKAKLDRQDDFLLLDCREQSEYDTAKIEGSTLIPMSEIQERVHELQPHRDREIIVHCHHGGRSQRVTEFLRGLGFDKAQNMQGGIDAWSLEIDSNVPRY